MSLAHAFSDANLAPQEARRRVIEHLMACLEKLDQLGEMVAAAHLSACIDALNSEGSAPSSV